MAALTNFLSETVKDINRAGHYTDEVLWVGSTDGSLAISWEKFEERAEGFWYMADDDWVSICQDLVVVGKDWWLERVRRDGPEHWVYRSIPRLDVDAEPFTRFDGDAHFLRQLNPEDAA